jgi:hypothetical protein
MDLHAYQTKIDGFEPSILMDRAYLKMQLIKR